jgi:hypothetical protein
VDGIAGKAVGIDPISLTPFKSAVNSCAQAQLADKPTATATAMAVKSHRRMISSLVSNRCAFSRASRL